MSMVDSLSSGGVTNPCPGSAGKNLAMPPSPTKPDFRAGLVMLAAMAVGTGLVQTPAGTALLG